MRSHYTTRSLLEPWRLGNGKIKYFDFTSNSFHEKSDAEIFQESGLLTKKQEDFYNKNIEREFGKAKRSFKKYGIGKINNNWKNFRAFSLYFEFQRIRLAKLVEKNDTILNTSLERIVNFSELEIDSLAKIESRKNDVYIFRANPNSPLFFPEIGFFEIPIFDLECLTGITMGVGVPIFQDVVVLKIPKSHNKDRLSESLTNLQSFSTGFGSLLNNRVVVPPSYFQGFTESEVSLEIKKLRARSEKILTAVWGYRNTVAETYKRLGFKITDTGY